MDKKVSIGICIVAIVVIIVCCVVYFCKKDNNKVENNVSTENNSQVEETKNYTFTATVIGVEEKRLTVEARDGDDAAVSTGAMVVLLGEDENQEFKVGDVVKVTYNGQIMRSEPAQVFAISIELVSSVDTVESETFTATVTEVGDKRLTVEIRDGDELGGLSGTVVVLLGEDKTFNVGDKVKVTYSGQVMMSEPPQVYATKIEKVNSAK